MYSLLYGPTRTSINVSWFYYCEKESLERDWGHIWTGFNIHCYLLTLFLGQGTGWLEASDLTSEKARGGKEVTVMGSVWPTGPSAGQMTVRTRWGLSRAVHWCVILSHGRGSRLPQLGCTHWLTVGGREGLDSMSGRSSPRLSVPRCAEYCVYTAFSVSRLLTFKSLRFSAVRSASLHNACHFLWRESLNSSILIFFLRRAPLIQNSLRWLEVGECGMCTGLNGILSCVLPMCPKMSHSHH